MCIQPRKPDIASLRRQVSLMTYVRDMAALEPDEYAVRWMHALVGLTDELLTELGEAEREACPAARTIWPTTETPTADWWEGVREMLDAAP